MRKQSSEAPRPEPFSEGAYHRPLDKSPGERHEDSNSETSPGP